MRDKRRGKRNKGQKTTDERRERRDNRGGKRDEGRVGNERRGTRNEGQETRDKGQEKRPLRWEVRRGKRDKDKTREERQGRETMYIRVTERKRPVAKDLIKDVDIVRQRLNSGFSVRDISKGTGHIRECLCFVGDQLCQHQFCYI
jgi:hypothetical protein